MKKWPTCVCCGSGEYEVDERGLCVYCQPCPDCGKYGTSCYEQEFRPRCASVT